MRDGRRPLLVLLGVLAAVVVIGVVVVLVVAGGDDERAVGQQAQGTTTTSAARRTVPADPPEADADEPEPDPPAADTIAPGTIEGLVTSASDDGPLLGAVVEAVVPDTGVVAATATQATGDGYTLTGLADGSYLVRARASGHHLRLHPDAEDPADAEPVRLAGDHGVAVTEIRLPFDNVATSLGVGAITSCAT
ncbi:MAG TPA: carboxypeptidase-like regulatory domain-containing protein, partial [Iamia sp.]|nr:carboxypeptidase-like regulatory domain-containing protein [Iamia sp.]